MAPRNWSVQNLVGGGNIANVYLTGSGGRKLMQGWPWPRVAVRTPVGKVKVAPRNWSVQNLVGLNFANVYLTGRDKKL